MHPFIKYLEERSEVDLPGKDAHMIMAPSPVNGGPVRLYDPPETVRRSSVLIPFMSKAEDHLDLLFTLRAPNIKHGGQISFPGGRLEDGESFDDAALREAYEEVGIPTSKIELLGCITDLYINHSNNHVKPVLGWMNYEPEFILQEEEVAEAFFVPFEQLLDENKKRIEKWQLQDFEYEVPIFNIHDVPLWGATAMIMSEVIELFREFERSV